MTDILPGRLSLHEQKSMIAQRSLVCSMPMCQTNGRLRSTTRVCQLLCQLLAIISLVSGFQRGSVHS